MHNNMSPIDTAGYLTVIPLTIHTSPRARMPIFSLKKIILKTREEKRKAAVIKEPPTVATKIDDTDPNLLFVVFLRKNDFFRTLDALKVGSTRNSPQKKQTYVITRL